MLAGRIAGPGAHAAGLVNFPAPAFGGHHNWRRFRAAAGNSVFARAPFVRGVKPEICDATFWPLFLAAAVLLLNPLAGWTQLTNFPAIDVRLKMRPAMLVSPLSLDFGLVPRNESRTNQFVVQNAGGGLLVGRLVVTGAFQVVSGGYYQLGPSESQSIKVIFRPSGGPSDHQVAQFTGGGGFKAFLSGNMGPASSNSSSNRSAVARSAKAVAAPPLLAISPSMLDFGLVPAGETRTNFFLITNEGGGRLEGKAIVLDPRQGLAATGKGPFQVVAGGTYSLESGAAQKVAILYHAGRAVREAAIIQFTGGGGANLAVSGAPGPARKLDPAKTAN